jgi:adenosine kinase
MSILVSGSLAFDTIAAFPGRFADQILPDQLHILNVSFLVPSLRREWGGCAGNIAYNLAQLGARASVTAAVGADGHDYVERLAAMGVDVAAILIDDDTHTAQAFIMTDRDNNQITAFHPGAMSQAHRIAWSPQGVTLGIVGPDGRDAMLLRARQLADALVPFVFDPGQGLPMFDGAELRNFLTLATWVAVNDYEAHMLSQRVGASIEELSRMPNLRGIVVTLAAEGCEVWQQGARVRVPPVKAIEVIDPTGCGDAFRAGLLVGLERGWTLDRCCVLGNRLGSIKIAHRGCQNHHFDREQMLAV